MKTTFSLRSLEALERPPGAGRPFLARTGHGSFAGLLARDQEPTNHERSSTTPHERPAAEGREEKVRERRKATVAPAATEAAAAATGQEPARPTAKDAAETELETATPTGRSDAPHVKEGAVSARSPAPSSTPAQSAFEPAVQYPVQAPESAPFSNPVAGFTVPAASEVAPAAVGESNGNQTTTPPSSASDTSPIQRAETVRPAAPARPVPIDAAALERADSILEQVRLRLKPGLRTVSLRLRPDSLGRIAIELSVEDGRLSAVVRAESPETLAALERHVPELRALMAQADLDVQEFDLALAQDGSEFDFSDEDPNAEGHDGAAHSGDSHSEQPDVAQIADLRHLLASDAGLDLYA